MPHGKISKTIIIGSGPAGYTAAVYAARANLEPVLFTGITPGGQLINTSEVENFPGYPNGVEGAQMMEDFRIQAERFGTRMVRTVVERVDFATGENYHCLWTDEGQEYRAYTVIIATGASARYLGLESEQRLLNKGVSACAVCDGFFFRGLEVAVVGGGDTACEEVTYLAKLCPHVHMIVRRDELRASKIMQQRLLKSTNVTIHWNSQVQEVLGENEVTGVRLINGKTGTTSDLSLQGLFVAIGHQPNTDIFKDYVDTDQRGYIITMGCTSLTGTPGIFACGDAMDHIYRQAVTAAGTGCRAALDAERYLNEHDLN
ncbi:MAG: thioredoxin-disulfide reductase [Desulfofustis sp. PB-SRB1]|jgi:thioredoxin reductase (NADPH)|nr:thioredoxin-disulfide reductase [Desulfofustis sp. PB-SRB1]MBM1001824.1 thioredoxin-disulfide reductase [Desulfofustis sp. PB-SRB1]HBH29689.1 thioredoxin-disulfide reductase [Desulfofustis sp.]